MVSLSEVTVMAGKIPQVRCSSGLYWTRYSQFKNSTIYWSIYQVNFGVFLHSFILFTISTINTKLQNFVNVGFLFLILWVSCCSVYPHNTRTYTNPPRFETRNQLKNLLYKHKWNTRWAFPRKLDILTDVKTTCYLHMWKNSPLLWLHNTVNRTFHTKICLSKMVWYFIGVYIIL